MLTVCNVGDSRVVLGHRVSPDVTLEESKEEEKEEIGEEESKHERYDGARLLAIPLSRDHTPYRKDERERVKKCGGQVMSVDQMEGTEDMHENWGDFVLGDVVDVHGDPPRVWVEGKDYPGCAFTRSLGDYLAEDIGVTADPEMLTTRLTTNDKVLVIASDGIFEFVANQEVIDVCSRSDNPLAACQSLVEAAYDQWLIHENRTDDITVIVCFLKCSRSPDEMGTTEDLVSLAQSNPENKPLAMHSTRFGTGSISVGDSTASTTASTGPESDCSTPQRCGI